jgi:hypothetical protein
LVSIAVGLPDHRGARDPFYRRFQANLAAREVLDPPLPSVHRLGLPVHLVVQLTGAAAVGFGAGRGNRTHTSFET